MLKQLIRLLVMRAFRAWPFLKGPGRFGDSQLCRYLTDSDEVIVTRLWRGPRIAVQVNDHCGRMLFFSGALDRKVDMLCNVLLRKGDNVVDIGSNFGAMTLRSAGIVGPEGQVHSFEPQPHLAMLIKESIVLNGFDNVHLHTIALSDQDTTADLAIPLGNCGMASLESRRAGVKSIRVNVSHAGQYLRNLGLHSVRLLKIDVEGHEHAILGAAESWLRTVRPDAVIFESLNDDRPFFERPVVLLLIGCGYSLYRVADDSWLMARAYQVRSESGVGAGEDFVAVKQDLAEGLGWT